MTPEKFRSEVERLIVEQQAVQMANHPSTERWMNASTEIHRLAAFLVAPNPNDRFLVTWGAGEEEHGRHKCDSAEAVRGMLEYDTDLNAEQIDDLILKGQRSDADDDPAACTQFDCNWIRVERLVR